jgi:hypothetical protein
MVSLSSSAIRDVGYDPDTRVLKIEFTSSSRVYAYFDVPEHHYHGLLSAASKGEYYNLYIRDQYSVR